MGMGKIMAVPTVNVAYNDEEAKSTKAVRGYVADHINTSLPLAMGEELIRWQIEPPGMVKCLPDFDQPSWVKPV
jgi:alpha-1,3-mannosyltransferase